MGSLAMAGCFKGCWGSILDEFRKIRRPIQPRGRSYKRARYSEKEFSIEFENLIDDEDFYPPSRRVVTDTETELITQRKYNELVEQQKRVDAEVDAHLRKQEDDLRLEEEAYYEAKREAAKAARQARRQIEERLTKQKEKTVFPKGIYDDGSLSSLNFSDDDSAELDAEDFDSFLEKVKARSLSAKTAEGGIFNNSYTATASWEEGLAEGVEATRIAGKSLEALESISPS